MRTKAFYKEHSYFTASGVPVFMNPVQQCSFIPGGVLNGQDQNVH